MSTLLSAIINSPFRVSNLKPRKEEILQKLIDLNIERCWDITKIGEREEGEWECTFMQYEDEVQYDFSGPFMHFISVYPHGVRIQILYNLKTLYQNFRLHWFAEFRRELFQTMQIFEATEMIFLSDGSSPLSGFDAEVMDGKTFEETKQNLQNRFGNPITNYRHLNSKLKGYDQINEWMLDDFADLKNGFNAYADVESD